ncbi:alpha-2-macroglobulin family protein [Pelagicoccus sp. SDUM812003]|uniref:alpha-2-macroglobulin family protein n=1 Tax=Pelagicoccus sp. SDUM812003 TaxID=3041267 RepID=UPI0028105AE8|nr:alpha-2-macroglobulin family protein [Pelagicoccus sp. SDUM812003]MDQ8203558.1 alpha-2-macroglobulin family protein [Pelagicoccus sp. SDUM812003]
MRPSFRILLVSLAALITPLATCFAQADEDLWLQVEEARQDGLPRTAIQILDTIIEQAEQSGQAAQALRANLQKISLEIEIQGGDTTYAIERLRERARDVPEFLRPAVSAITAHFYWSYFQQNRWSLLERSTVSANDSDDIKTWDLSKLLSEIDRHFSAALENEAVLQSLPISDYSALLDMGNVPLAYRPTLYDFLAHEALAFYQAGEQAAMIAENAFQLSEDDPLFAPVETFLDWQLPPAEGYSPELKALHLYQKLLRFHLDDEDPTAFYDANLSRLIYAGNIAVSDQADQELLHALQAFAHQTASHEVSARAWAKIAELQLSADAPDEAHQAASRGVATFPESIGGLRCQLLIDDIEEKSLRLESEMAWTTHGPEPLFQAVYRNVSKLHLRLYRLDFEDNKPVENPSERALLSEWTEELPQTSDFRENRFDLQHPELPEPGRYLVAASAYPDFPDDYSETFRFTHSDLALVLERQPATNQIYGIVVDAVSGEPAPDVNVRVWSRGNYQKLIAEKGARSDAEGRFQYKASRDSRLVFQAEREGHLATQEIYVGSPYQPNQHQVRTTLFTDRALYRPGQTIHFKGICTESDPQHGRQIILPRKKVTLGLVDLNGQAIDRLELLSNDYGSFSGSFTAPSSGAFGTMRLIVQKGPRGSVDFNVEEYKRPKFEVTLEQPTKATKLDENVLIEGDASAYTGAAIDGAKVVWRVERSVERPLWCWWWQPPETKAIAHGQSVTDAQGRFQIEFVAEPDLDAPRENEPRFAFTIHADVTDNSGETRSAQAVTLSGYTAMKASISTEEELTTERPVAFTLTTETLDGSPLSAKGRLRIHRLEEPESVHRAPWGSHRPQGPYAWKDSQPADRPPYDASNPETWPLGKQVRNKSFRTNASGIAELPFPLEAGIYRAALESKDAFGNPVTASKTFTVIDPHSDRFPYKIPHYLSVRSNTLEPGQTFSALWGTGYPSGRAYVEFTADDETLVAYWTEAGNTQQRIEFPVTDELRGGFTLSLTFVRDNRAYLVQEQINVPWSNKRLQIDWESFRSKLEPGQRETWTATITGPESELAAAEMLACLYDASLDQFRSHSWTQSIATYRQENNYRFRRFNNFPHQYHLNFPREYKNLDTSWNYPSFPIPTMMPGLEEIYELSPFSVADVDHEGYRAVSTLAGSRMKTRLADHGSAISVTTIQTMQDTGATGNEALLSYTANTEVGGAAPPPPALDQVQSRANLAETAFFFPHLLSDEDGVVKIQFTLPDTLTRWRFMGLAHDKDTRVGFLSDSAVTAKDLMVQPNPPRFLREGDEVEFTVKVTNLSDDAQSGQLRLTFAEAASLQDVSDELGIRQTEQAFDVPAKASRSYSWRLKTPDGARVLSYKVVGASDSLSDGEEGYLPVLSRRILVTESLPLPIRGNGEKVFRFEKLLESENSDSLVHQSLNVQMVSQPIWYAVQSLPYLMEYAYECNEQLFNRYYANALAAHIARSDPKVRRIFDLWKNTSALDSPLEKNQELKSMLIEETPWLRDAKSESQAKRRLGILFDENRLQSEATQALRKLEQRRHDDSSLWSWFSGYWTDHYISLYITTGFGRLRHLGVETDMQLALDALPALDDWIKDRYQDVQKLDSPQAYAPAPLECLYLYGRSFFLADRPISESHREAVDFFIEQAKARWLDVSSRQNQAQLALALQRFGEGKTAIDIVRSLNERSLKSEEMGMYWSGNDRSWWWHQAPIETQALMIEAFDEVAQDAQAVEDLKVWLIKQKQTNSWKTTKGTADAIYALLLRGDDLLSSDELVSVTLGSYEVKPENVEAGTGFYQKTFTPGEIEPAMGQITVSKPDQGVSWGSLHWQYLEDMENITAHTATPLTLEKQLFVKETTAQGPVLKAVDGPVSVGDELVVRLILRSDRDMEYLHLKDQRGSGTEPVDVISQQRYQDGLGYFQSTRDTASHFFIDQLDAGTYVFEYSTRVQLKGRYQTGIAEIQCMYAPEFNSHSESIAIEVD